MMAKLLYKPVDAVFGALGGLAAASLLKKLWTVMAGEEDAPAATQAGHGWGEILLAAALQRAIFGLVKAAVDRAGATGFGGPREHGRETGDRDGGACLRVFRGDSVTETG
jgi:hypothetical protein